MVVATATARAAASLRYRPVVPLAGDEPPGQTCARPMSRDVSQMRNGFTAGLLEPFDDAFGAGLADPRHHDHRRVQREVAGGEDTEPGRRTDDLDDIDRVGSRYLQDDLALP